MDYNVNIVTNKKNGGNETMGVRKVRQQQVKFSRGNVLEEGQMKKIIGSGNSQVRFIPDEYLQAKILKEGVVK